MGQVNLDNRDSLINPVNQDSLINLVNQETVTKVKMEMVIMVRGKAMENLDKKVPVAETERQDNQVMKESQTTVTVRVTEKVTAMVAATETVTEMATETVTEMATETETEMATEMVMMMIQTRFGTPTNWTS